MITGGAPLFAHKHKLYNDILKEKGSNCRVILGYGLSEVTAPAFININDEYGALGRPFPAISYKIVDYETLEEVSNGQSGELWLRANHKELTPLAVGYLNNPQETEKTFVYSEEYRWVRTGDKVHENKDNAVVWESRYKNILTFNGFNIDCDKLLKEVEKIDGIGKAAIIGAITKDGNQRPIICIELLSGHQVGDLEWIKSSIRRKILEEMPDYYEPLDIVVYDSLPIKSMKVNYNQLKQDNLNEFGEYIKTSGIKKGAS